MHLIELFLPLYDNAGEPFAKSAFDAVRDELTHAFGGVTAFVRSPAVGAWKDEGGEVCRDDVILFEVMTDELDRGWWQDYRRKLESRFEQEEILIRVSAAERL